MSENVLVIEAGRTEGEYWKDLWRYRELFYFLARRHILVRTSRLLWPDLECAWPAVAAGQEQATGRWWTLGPVAITRADETSRTDTRRR